MLKSEQVGDSEAGSTTECKKANHKAKVFETIGQVGKPFLEAMKEAYPDRGWRMCGPAAIALSRILSTTAEVPIGRDLQGEHIEVTVGIFDPQDRPDRLDKMEEQTYIRYHDGQGSVAYIDPIYGLLMEGRKNLEGAIQVEDFPEPEIDAELVRRHNLHTFSPLHDQIDRVKAFSGNTPAKKQLIFDETVNALNDHRATLPTFVTEHGVHQTEWAKTEPVIKKFAPAWKKDLQKTVDELRRACEVLMPQREEGFGGRMDSSRFIMPEPIRMRPFRSRISFPKLEELNNKPMTDFRIDLSKLDLKKDDKLDL